MENICELYSGLQDKNSKEGFMPVLPLSFSHKFFLGVSDQGMPMFLIDYKLDDIITDFKLECISVLFNKNCRLIDDNNKEFSKICSVIMLNSQNYDFQNYFLEVMYLMLQRIPVNPSSREIKNEIDKIVTLFSYASKPAVKTIQGLWAELFIISQSENPEYLIQAWHNNPRSKFDFNDGIDKIEVKSAGQTQRVHSFSLEQLDHNENSRLIIASVFTMQTGIGKNINDLRSMVFSRINSLEIQSIFDSIVFQTLGNDLENSFEFYYDYQFAADNLLFFDAELIPKIRREYVPPEITDVRFVCNLSSVPDTSKDKLKSLPSELLRSL